MSTHDRQIIAVFGVIRNAEGKFLMQKRNQPKISAIHGKWEFPGGGIDFGESAKEALIRECKEEIGCTVMPERLLPLVESNVWRHTDRSSVQVFLLCYLCTISEGEPHPTDEEVSEVRWCTKEEAMLLDTLPGAKQFLEIV